MDIRCDWSGGQLKIGQGESWLEILGSGMVHPKVLAAAGVDPTRALVLSQVVLSLALPVPMIALVTFTRRRDLMGAFANGRLTQAASFAGAAIVLGLNAVLLAQAFGVPVPGLAAD